MAATLTIANANHRTRHAVIHAGRPKLRLLLEEQGRWLLWHVERELASQAKDRQRLLPRPTARRRPVKLRLTKTPVHNSRWTCWAQLLERVFGVDSPASPRCREQMTLRTVVVGPPATVNVLTGLKLPGTRAAVMAWVEACRGLCKGWVGMDRCVCEGRRPKSVRVNGVNGGRLTAGRWEVSWTRGRAAGKLGGGGG